MRAHKPGARAGFVLEAAVRTASQAATPEHGLTPVVTQIRSSRSRAVHTAFVYTFSMKIYLAGDHAGFNLKTALLAQLPLLGHDVVDLGPHALNPDDDYPDYVTPLAKHISKEKESFGIVCAGSGQGEAMCANRMKGVRAAVFYGKMRATEALDAEGGHSEDGFDPIRLARRHNNANILSIGARFVSPDDAHDAIRIFLETVFDVHTTRHARRLKKF